jgi:hypothetical protein
MISSIDQVTNPKSWVVETSPDNENWTIVDTRENNNDLDDMDVLKSFNVSSDAGEAQFVRLRQIGPAHSGKYFMAISAFEVFGTLSG